MKLIITIDTEEDDWRKYASKGHSLENIKKIPQLQEMFDIYGVRPTYLLSYPIAMDKHSSTLFRELAATNRCEIGTHCHPWNTPPFEEELNPRNSFLCNLPSDLQFKKLSTLHQAICTNIDTCPTSFRSGRWGYGKIAAEWLELMNYKVDSSISNYLDWSEYFGPDYSMIPPFPFRFSPKEIYKANANGNLIEIPATTGYLQRNERLCNYLYRNITKNSLLKNMRLLGLLAKLKLINRVSLCPEYESPNQMISLIRSLRDKGVGVINMMFHSPALKAGLTPFVKTGEDELQFLDRIERIIKYAHSEDIEVITLSETHKYVA